jgi:hypothetical protein
LPDFEGMDDPRSLAYINAAIKAPEHPKTAARGRATLLASLATITRPREAQIKWLEDELVSYASMSESS